MAAGRDSKGRFAPSGVRAGRGTRNVAKAVRSMKAELKSIKTHGKSQVRSKTAGTLNRLVNRANKGAGLGGTSAGRSIVSMTQKGATGKKLNAALAATR